MITTIISCLMVVAIILLTIKVNTLEDRTIKQNIRILFLENEISDVNIKTQRIDQIELPSIKDENGKRDSDIIQLRKIIVETITEDCPLEDMVEGIEIRSLANYEQIELLMDHLKLKVVEEKLTIKKK